MSAADVHAAHAANTKYLLDVVVRVLCVLALDQFADFVGDQVVAPVRETAAQVLGVTVIALPSHDVEQVLQHLLQLWSSPAWQTRMAALTAVKYLVAARVDMAVQLGAMVLPTALMGLHVCGMVGDGMMDGGGLS